MLDLKELRGYGIAELKAKAEELKQTYSKEYVKTKVGSKSDKAVNLRNIKKDVARVLTVITEKENKSFDTQIKKETKVVEKGQKEVKGKTETKKSK